MVTPSETEKKKGYFSHFKYSLTSATNKRWGGEKGQNTTQCEAKTVRF